MAPRAVENVRQAYLQSDSDNQTETGTKIISGNHAASTGVKNQNDNPPKCLRPHNHQRTGQSLTMHIPMAIKTLRLSRVTSNGTPETATSYPTTAARAGRESPPVRPIDN